MTMSNSLDTEPTLPAVVAARPPVRVAQRLVLTVVFHPDVARIGETAVVSRQRGRAPHILGRTSPLFGAREDIPGRALEERHVSRQALEMQYDGRQLRLCKPEGASRCLIGGEELIGEKVITWDALRSGVPILLGHAVVLLLRLGDHPGADLPADPPGGRLCGSSAYMRILRGQLAQVGASEAHVLVSGETGTGKELVATALHAASPRAQSALVSVNMSAIPGDLAPAALFGTARGSFTGAREATAGYFEQAHGGSLFLDEVGDTPAAIQPQLLRVLQQREIQRVGGPVRQVDVRVISATDAELEDGASGFKSALRHRLAAQVIHLLPLREHPEDVGEIMRHFLSDSYPQGNGPGCLPDENTDAIEIAAWAEFFHSLLFYHWPGNVRELENFAGRVRLASQSQLCVPASVADTLREDQAEQVSEALNFVQHSGPRYAQRSREGAMKPAQYRPRQEVDAEEFERVFRASDFEVARAARRLGASRQTVYRMIEESSRLRLARDISPEELRQSLDRHGGEIIPAARQLQVSPTSLRARLRHLGIKR